jgi:nucleotide-binding universal stress UspA family protein
LAQDLRLAPDCLEKCKRFPGSDAGLIVAPDLLGKPRSAPVTIVYSFDFSEAAFEGLAGAAAIAARLQRPLVLAYAVGPGIRTLGPGVRERIEDATRARLEGLAAELKTAEAGLRVATVQVQGDAVTELLQIAADHRAELLILSSPGHPELRRRMSTVSEKVAHSAEIPVLVMREPGPWRDWARGRRPLRAILGISRDKSCLGALELTSRLRAAAPCDVIATEVYSPSEMTRHYGLPMMGSSSGPDAELEKFLERDLAKRVSELKGLGDLKIRAHPGSRHAADQLLDLAEREQASVVITGRHRPVGPFRFESVTETLLHEAKMSVLVVPDSARVQQSSLPACRRILAATDMTEAGNEAVRYATALAAAVNGGLHLLHVVVGGDRGWEEEARLASQLRQLVPEGLELPVSTEVLFAREPAACIATAAERTDADVICVAAHGKGPVERLALGSVSQDLLGKTQRPVLIVRRNSEVSQVRL